MAQLRPHNVRVGEASFDLVNEILSGARLVGKRGRIIPASLHRELPTRGSRRNRETFELHNFRGGCRQGRDGGLGQPRAGESLVGSWNSIRKFLGRGTSCST